MESRKVNTSLGNVGLIVTTLEGSPSLAFRVSDGGSTYGGYSTGTIYLTDDEARALAANLIAAADEADEANSRWGETYDEMRLEA